MAEIRGGMVNIFLLTHCLFVGRIYNVSNFYWKEGIENETPCPIQLGLF
ncbi:hypothetical protein [Gracilibacillus alcaliphilus]|nr:hypothetical protein [Gracilibacillus alcaliphilus]MBM7679490.1 hypothetical protein [Gracilibacillus alcaliphilus]